VPAATVAIQEVRLIIATAARDGVASDPPLAAGGVRRDLLTLSCT